MGELISALVTLLFGACAALLAGRSRHWSGVIGVSSVVLASIFGLVGAVRILITGTAMTLHWVWHVPYGSFLVEIDPLSAFFLIPLFVLAPLVAIYNLGYFAHSREEKNLGVTWFFYNLLLIGITLVFLARNGVLFLVAWEVMSLAAYFLVVFDSEKQDVREAGWTYLVATHIGTAFLLVMFILLGKNSGTLDFDLINFAGGENTRLVTAIFILALVGFGTKAGFFPLHVWLPEAHPAAPSGISALLSGVMIKTGIYGLLRVMTLLGPPPLWWGWTLIGIGATSGMLGVLFALAQHDLKRLLAYSSVENVGIITMGIGVGVVGVSSNMPVVAFAGFAGALLHTLNHALFKGLLFLGAGAVLHTTGTRQIDRLGGLLKGMPWTGGAFFVGAFAISGLPPLNGFVSEFLIYFAAFSAKGGDVDAIFVPLLAAIVALALIGGLVVACFTTAFGAVFLGQPRSTDAEGGHEVAKTMRAPMVILAGLCVALALGAPWVVRWMAPAPYALVAGMGGTADLATLADVTGALVWVVIVSGCVLGVAGVLFLLRWRLLRNRKVTETVTWDCGYAAPTKRMQYTPSSFTQAIVDLFATVLRTRKTIEPIMGAFPRQGAITTTSEDVVEHRIFRPLFARSTQVLEKLRWLQQGRVQLYVLYIAITLLALLLWKVA